MISGLLYMKQCIVYYLSPNRGSKLYVSGFFAIWWPIGWKVAKSFNFHIPLLIRSGTSVTRKSRTLKIGIHKGSYLNLRNVGSVTNKYDENALLCVASVVVNRNSGKVDALASIWSIIFMVHSSIRTYAQNFLGSC